jgi:hypothetical protein
MTMRTQDGYRVSRARREKAFDLHYCRKRSSIELLGGIIHQHFVNIASRLSWALRRLTNHSIDGMRDGQGIWDVDMHERLSTLSYSLLLGLASLATRQGIDTEYLDDDGATNYVSAVTTGHVPNKAGHPPERVCQQLMSCFTVVFHDSEIWRGWTTALPHKGIGYGCMSTAGKWTSATMGPRADYRVSLSDNNMSLLATGMYGDGITVNSPQADVIAALRRSANIVVMNTCRPGRCATTVGAALLMAPNRL